MAAESAGTRVAGLAAQLGKSPRMVGGEQLPPRMLTIGQRRGWLHQFANSEAGIEVLKTNTKSTKKDTDSDRQNEETGFQ